MSSRFPLLLVSLLLFLFPVSALAHCDTLDGPVVSDARLALSRGDVTPVLKWVGPQQENEITQAFHRTLRVRRLGEEARAMADRYFFETLVRIHRQGEGQPYTGLKPAGAVEPGIAAADRALDTGSADPLLRDLTAELAAGLRARFARVQAARKHLGDSVPAGRRYVAAYVEFIHYVEDLRQQLHGAAEHQHQEHAGETASAAR